MPILRGPDNALTKDLSELEKSLGVDLQIGPNGDLVLNNISDFELVAGVQNAAQAVYLKLNIEPGGLVYHPEIGTALQIGEKTKSAIEIKAQILKSLAKDPRFGSVDAKVQVLSDVILVDLRVTLANTGIEVPLQFAVPT